MGRIVSGLLLVVLGATFTRMTLTGVHASYVKDSFGWAILAAAALAFALGTHQVLATGTAEVHHPRIGLLFLIPLAAILIVEPGPLGAYAAGRAISFSETAGADNILLRYADLPDPVDGAIELPLPAAYSRAADGEAGDLEGRRVRLEGFITRRDGQLQLSRMVISCCAADATAAHIALGNSDTVGGPWPDDTWLQIEATFEGELLDGTGTPSGWDIPVFTLNRAEPIPQPRNPYS